MAKREIRWTKWADPIAHILKKDSFAADLDEDEDEDLDHARHSFISEVPDKTPENIGPVLVGHQGVIPLFEKNIPSKTYNFWMGHTNFKITYGVCDNLITVPGVEDLLVFSRYRFRLCIGHVFNDKEVRKNIEELLCNKRKKKKQTAIVPGGNPDKIKMALLSRYKYWAVIQFGSHSDYVFGNTRDEVEDQLKCKQIPVGAGVVKSYH